MHNRKKNTLMLLVGAVLLLFAFRKKAPGTVAASFDEYFDISKYSALKSYWYDISKMETAGFKSNLCVAYFNLFGMKMPSQRNTLALGKVPGSDFARFASYGDSVQDLILYLNARQYPTSFPSLESMVNYMASKSYFVGESAESYYKKVLAWRNK